MVPSGNILGRFKFMSLMSMKNNTRQSWGMISVSVTVIYQVNIIGKYQQELLVSIDIKGRLIGCGDVDPAGMDWGGDENDASLKIENKNDLDYQEDPE